MSAMTLKTAKTLLGIAAIAVLAVALGGGSAYAGSKVGAKKLKATTIRTALITVPAGQARIISAECEPGERALEVGATWNGAPTVGPVSLAALSLTGGTTNPTGASAAGNNGGNSPRTLTVSVSCLHK